MHTLRRRNLQKYDRFQSVFSLLRRDVRGNSSRGGMCCVPGKQRRLVQAMLCVDRLHLRRRILRPQWRYMHIVPGELR